jgi:hypothetical protein
MCCVDDFSSLKPLKPSRNNVITVVTLNLSANFPQSISVFISRMVHTINPEYVPEKH